ncbi:MAG: DUF3710 domain-containing protein [Candidatus Nanopelagicales bacterium]
MFRRRKGEPAVEPSDELEVDAADVQDEVEVEQPAEPAYDRGSGPFDASEVPDDGVTRLDLGGLRVAGAEGMEIRLEVDEASQNVVAVTIVTADSALQLTAFAAPRTEGIWADVRREIRGNLAAGGTVDELDGPFGPELQATITQPGPDGRQVTQPVRFVGVDGPRWFLRGLFTGRAAREGGAAAPLEAAMRATVVVRGSDPMAPGDALPLSVPTAVPEGMSRGETPDRRTPLPPPERGPEITEIR